MSLNILYTTLTLLLTFIPLLSFNGYFNKGINVNNKVNGVYKMFRDIFKEFL